MQIVSLPMNQITYLDVSPDEEYQHFVIYSNTVIRPYIQPDINPNRRLKLELALTTAMAPSPSFQLSWDETGPGAAKVIWSGGWLPSSIGDPVNTTRQTYYIELTQDPFDPAGVWHGKYTEHLTSQAF